MLVDMPLSELEVYEPTQYKERDFDNFWENKLKLLETEPLKPKEEELNYIIDKIITKKIYYNGFDRRSSKYFFL
jgi:cephalosporin-C deacetylase-like acetyl esterase